MNKKLKIKIYAIATIIGMALSIIKNFYDWKIKDDINQYKKQVLNWTRISHTVQNKH